jgi:glycogen debranching enzyme
MKVTHFLNSFNQETREVEAKNFLTSNKRGDFLWMGGENSPESRYEGWFCRLSENEYEEKETINSPTNIFKIIEAIKPEGEEVSHIQNEFNHIKRKRGMLWELFYLPDSSHTLVYELSRKGRVEVFFDVKEIYSLEDSENYTIEEKEELLIIEFANKIFLAINCESGENVKKIISRYYKYDERRNSFPFYRNILHGVSLFGKRFVFSVSRNKKRAIEEARKDFKRSIIEEKKRLDIVCAKKSLEGFLVSDIPALCAGFPWFFHFWPRDEAISLKSFLSIDPKKGKEIFFRLLERGLQKGPLGVVNIDAIGWIFKRAEDILPISDASEKEKIKRYLKKYLEEFLWSFTENDFAINRPHETWMDSLERDGARIEIQAMRLNMYRLAKNMAKKGSEKNFYKKMEEELKKKIYNAFFDGKNLYDGYYPKTKILEKTIRPNIFIAYYFYPELLSKKEWTSCFDSALDLLWLSWGGLATIDKNNENFCIEHTGENPKSYHQGDSWFYVNNLTAIVLYRLNNKKYFPYIKKIMEASKVEMMWKGTVGHHGELSSAKELRSEGCPSQAWSVATYLEMKREVK